MTLSENIFKRIGYDTTNFTAKFMKPVRPKEKDRFISVYLHDYQADLVSMPDDNGYKYIFVVVNMTTKRMDAVPLMERTGVTVGNALATVVGRYPQVLIDSIENLRTDAGAEFNNQQFMHKCKLFYIDLTFASTRRKNQMAIAEFAVKTVSKYLIYKMSQMTIETNIRSKDWVQYLPIVIEEINKFYSEKFNQMENIKDVFDMVSPLQKFEDLIPIGVQVFPRLFKPTDTITGKKMYGDFRTGDIRYDYNLPCVIKEWLIRAGHPARYVLEDVMGGDINDTTFLKEELLILPNQPKTVKQLDEMRKDEIIV
jgi:hypothetical protein